MFAAGPDGDVIRRKAAEVFDRAEFKPDDSWITFGKWLGQFFGWLGRLGSTAPFVFWGLLIACIIIFVMLLVHIIRTMVRSGSLNVGGLGGASRTERLRRSAAHFSQAGDCANAGDYTEAIRHLFLSLVFRFDEAGRMVLRPGATNREYLRLLNDKLPERREIGGLVDFLDDYWYAKRASDKAQYDRSLDVYER